jgi:hypothetical protein
MEKFHLAKMQEKQPKPHKHAKLICQWVRDTTQHLFYSINGYEWYEWTRPEFPPFLPEWQYKLAQ